MPGPSSLRDTGRPGNIAVPGSPALSTTSFHLGPHVPPHLRPAAIVSRKDQALSISAYETLLTASKSYTQALLGLSGASNDFAFALQECARLKGAHRVGPQLHAASGLEFLVASHSKLLADSFWKDFSIPLLEAFDAHRLAVAERQVAHDRVMAERSRELKQCEERNLVGGAGHRGGRGHDGGAGGSDGIAPGRRDLVSFRRALEELQRLVDGLDEERAAHYVDVLAAEEEEWDKVADRVSHLLRLQLEVHERLSSKPLSDPVLEPMLTAIPDPFNAYNYGPSSASSFDGAHGSTSGANNHGGSGVGGANGTGVAPGEIFSVLQHSGLLGEGGPGGVGVGGGSAGLGGDVTPSYSNDYDYGAGAAYPHLHHHHHRHAAAGTGADEVLTPAGLLSPRTPATGLPRAPTTGAGAGAGANAGQAQAPPQSQSHSQGGTTSGTGTGAGAGAPLTFAALGLTAASEQQHAQGGQTSSPRGDTLPTSTIGSPLFGSEDGSQDGGDGHGHGDDDDDAARIDAAVALAGSSAAPSRAKTTAAAAAATATTATAAANASATPRTARSTGGGLGLGRRLKKALSIIDDEGITEEEKRRSLSEFAGLAEGAEAAEAAEAEQQQEQQQPAGGSAPEPSPEALPGKGEGPGESQGDSEAGPGAGAGAGAEVGESAAPVGADPASATASATASASEAQEEQKEE